MHKVPFDIDLAFQHLEKIVAPYPKAGLFELQEEGFDSAFELLVACIISIRTYDEVMLPCARKLFEAARTPEAMSQLRVEQIDDLIRTSTFHENKAKQIHNMAVRIVEEFEGQLPYDLETMTSFKGVGPKCANLVLGIACHQPMIGVDIHVHRIVNRWGYVKANTPEKTLVALEQKLPQKYWVDINRLLVPFGKHLCTGKRPQCATCSLIEMCHQVDVVSPR